MADYIQTGLSSFKDLLVFLRDRARSKDITKNALLRELRDNLTLLGHRDKAGVNLQAILKGLSAIAIEEAYKKNYHFGHLTGNAKLDKKLILHKRQEKYIGWTAEKFMYNIEGKINDLKNLPALFPDLGKAPVNLPLRLENLFYQLLLLAAFIRKNG